MVGIVASKAQQQAGPHTITPWGWGKAGFVAEAERWHPAPCVPYCLSTLVSFLVSLCYVSRRLVDQWFLG